MKRRIHIVTVLQLIALLCLSGLPANTRAVGTSSTQGNQQPSEAELATRFNAILDKELSGEKVCVTISAARELNALMTAAAQKLVKAKAFDRVGEAEANVRKFAKALLKNGTEAGVTRITHETIAGLMSATATTATEPPESAGGPETGGGRGPRKGLGDLFCPLFPIC